MSKQNIPEAENNFQVAQRDMTTMFSDHHPMAVKFNQYLVETYNAKGTSPEVSKILNDICESNLKILQACYG